MRLCRFNDDRLGMVDGTEVIDVTKVLGALSASTYPFPRSDIFIANLKLIQTEVLKFVSNNVDIVRHQLADIRLLSPVANPGKVIAAPVNYAKHLQEAREDKAIHHQNQVGEIQRVGLFLKATSSLEGASAEMHIARADRRNDHEIELVAVIGRRGRNISVADALDYVAGYCVGLDMTVRGPEERSMRKSPDGYTVLGPWLTTADDIPNPHELELVLKVNGEVRQHAYTRDLVLNVAELIAMASTFYTLHEGDVIMTGTPEGVSQVHPGDQMTAEITGLGMMSVSIAAE